MIDTAYAMGAPAGGGGGGDVNTLLGFLPMVLIFGVFYFLLIRPQQKKAKEHKSMLDTLKVGSKVITQGGLYGQITKLEDQIVTMEIAEKVRVRVSRGHIAGLAAAPPSGESNS
jgi:preprotein translocase subunit YajC